MDFDEKNLLNDCVLIGMTTKGIFNYQDIRNLDFKNYDYLVKECVEIFKKLNKSEE